MSDIEQGLQTGGNEEEREDQNPNLTGDPREGAATITSYIVQMSLGDLPHGSLAYTTIFAAGLVLFLMTLSFNIIGFVLRRRFREAY